MRFSATSINTAPDLTGLNNSLFIMTQRTFFFGVTNEGRTSNRTGKHLTNSQLAFLMEYGDTEKSHFIPARPFVGPVLHQNISIIEQVYSTALEYYLRGEITDGDRQLYALGNYLVARMRERILAHIPPKLSDKTLRIRRSKGIFDDTPLKETGQLMDSIGFTITNLSPSVAPIVTPPTEKTSFFGKIKRVFGF